MTNPGGVLRQEHVASLFGTPLCSYLWPDSDALNLALRHVILQKAKAEAGIVRSNVGGWHSAPDLFQWQDDAVAILKDRVIACVSDMMGWVNASERGATVNLRADCWANVARQGHYNSVHDHPGATWSGVYYISSGDPDSSNPFNGKLELIDPRAGINLHGQGQAAFSGRCLIDALPGLMVVFPGWLKHMAHPYSGPGERISVSFNIYVS